MKFIATVRVFDHGHNEEADGERAWQAVSAYLDKLPSEAETWFNAYAAELNGEDHDAKAAEQWDAIEREAFLIAKCEAVRGWVKPENATVTLDIFPDKGRAAA